jgi:hypothetical protein
MMYKASKLMSETSKLMFRARAKGEIKVNAARNHPICARGSPANQSRGALAHLCLPSGETDFRKQNQILTTVCLTCLT